MKIKPFFKTSEFWISAFFIVATLAATAALVVPPSVAVKVGAFAVGCYTLSRGLAKLTGTDVPPLLGIRDINSPEGRALLLQIVALMQATQADADATDAAPAPRPPIKLPGADQGDTDPRDTGNTPAPA